MVTPPASGDGIRDCATDSTALLAAAITAFAAQDLDALTGGALSEELIAMCRGMDRLEAELSRRITRFDNQRGHVTEGFGSAVSWLRVHGRMSAADAMQRVELGRRLPALEGAEEAFRRGEIGFRNATVLARAVAETGAEHIAPAAPTLVELAKTQDPFKLRVCTRHARYCANPDGTLADAERDHQHRGST